MSDSKPRSRVPALLILAAFVTMSPACAHPRALALEDTRHLLEGLDEFGALLLGAGLPVESIPTGREVSPSQAKQIRFTLTILPSLPQNYAPRFVADELLAFIASQAQPVSRWDLTAKVQEYRNHLLLTPQGYLADALTGKPALCVGPIQVREDSAGAGVFDMGVFYMSTDGEKWPRRAVISVLAAP